MSKKVDAVVIGTGPGGSITGAYLAKGGLKTAVFEKESNIGGPLYGSHVTAGCTIDNFVHVPLCYTQWSDPRGYWWKAALEVGASILFQFLPNSANGVLGAGIGPCTAYCSNGEAFVHYLKTTLPEPLPEKSLKTMARVFDEVVSIPEQKIFSKEYDMMPFSEWVYDITDDPVVLKLLSELASVLLVTPAEMALQRASVSIMASTFFGMNCGWLALGATILGPADTLPKAFCKVVVDNGGDVLTSHPVTSVIIDEGRAKGVVVRDPNGCEEIFEAEEVIVSTNYQSYRDLFGENLPKSINDVVNRFYEHQAVAIDRHFVLNKKIASPWYSQAAILTSKMEYEGVLVIPFDPTLCPPGKQVIMAERFIPKEQYKTRPKGAWFEDLANMTEQMFPGTKAATEATCDHIAVGAALHGMYAGPKIPLECPGIKHLYFASDCCEETAPLCATEKAASAAAIVAKKILRRRGLMISR